MATSQRRPLARTSSTCAREAARGGHVFKISGYSLHRGVGAGESIQSAAFVIGGLTFCVRFYPDGYSTSDDDADYVAAFLHLLTKNARARASVEFSLVDQTSSSSSTAPAAAAAPKVTEGTEFGTRRLMKRTELEASAYLREDCLVIECDVLVINEPRVVVEETAATTTTTTGDFEVLQVPPPPNLDLSGSLRKFLEEKRGVDVTFKVRGELFKAHKIVLAMRSPVFAAQFYGPMAAEDTRRRHIVVEDMHPQVFRALLQFIYTDAMPSMEDYCGVDDDDDRQEIVRHLLVAADRYAMERLKLICEGILCKSLDADNVAAALVLADEHHCSTLKEACVEFITSAKGINSTVVVPRQGSMRLKRVFPASFVDMLWKVTGCMHGCFQFVGISREGDV
ncbi:hypothetical protein HU200_015528 [Digitaria exilis]|uniref:Uncharacterized protein n=1 Tax=Digitaria exilis TaxID=1010633 RepID=A0A835KJP2_9POAL|nr:hypothetical protein HU200_015528 [Digitaria exilis]CAB3469815.1 unnamed protein product [Digitaria exilis]